MDDKNFFFFLSFFLSFFLYFFFCLPRFELLAGCMYSVKVDYPPNFTLLFFTLYLQYKYLLFSVCLHFLSCRLFSPPFLLPSFCFTYLSLSMRAVRYRVTLFLEFSWEFKFGCFRFTEFLFLRFLTKMFVIYFQILDLLCFLTSHIHFDINFDICCPYIIDIK